MPGVEQADTRWRCVLVIVACAVAIACADSGPNDAALDVMRHTLNVPSTLQTWVAEVTLTVGYGTDSDSLATGDLSRPTALGTDSDGNIYVMEPYVREVRVYDAAGHFQRLLVRPGGGPGEMRYPALSFGLNDGFVWYAEYPTGQMHFVSTDGSVRYTRDTGFTPQTVGAKVVLIEPTEIDGQYVVRAETATQLMTSLRPSNHVRIFIANHDSITSVYEYETTSAYLLLDQGRTMVAYPGPPDHAVVFYDHQDGRILRIDRPTTTSSIVLRYLRSGGIVTAHEEVRVEEVALSAVARDSIEMTLKRRASFDGRRSLERDVERALAMLSATIPARLPAFDLAVQGPGNTTLLRLYHNSLGGPQRWLALDSTFHPKAWAVTPENVVEMAFREDGKWWATMRAPSGVQYIANLEFKARGVR